MKRGHFATRCMTRNKKLIAANLALMEEVKDMDSMTRMRVADEQLPCVRWSCRAVLQLTTCREAVQPLHANLLRDE